MQMDVRGVPELEALYSTLERRPQDFFVLPSLTNFKGHVRADRDPCGLSGIAFPPLSMGYVPTCEIEIDAKLFRSSENAIKYRWNAYSVTREAIQGSLELKSVMYMPPERRSAVVSIEVIDRNSSMSGHLIAFRLNGRITKSFEWGSMLPEAAQNHVDLHYDDTYNAFIFRNRDNGAVSMQGFRSRPADIIEITPTSLALFRIKVGKGKSWKNTFVCSLGRSIYECRKDFRSCIRNTHGLDDTRSYWKDVFSAAFTEGNDYFSGHLPVLKTVNEHLMRTYYMSVLTALYQRRNTEESRIGTAYVALSPNAWATTVFLWDLALSSDMLALLDPDTLHSLCEHLLSLNIKKWFGIDYLTGNPVGYWYAANDYCAFETLMNLVRYGRIGCLEKVIAGRSISSHLLRLSSEWKRLDRNGDGIADYGDIDNNLECVSTYRHGLAAFQAANIYMYETLSRELSLGRRSDRKAVEKLLKGLMELDVAQTGYWRSKQPGGFYNEVRHIYDFIMTAGLIPHHIPEAKKRRMVEYVEGEMLSPIWLHALSPQDGDAHYSSRTDHQSEGAYVAWPSETALALIALGRKDIAATIIDRLGKVSRQGPFGQAYYADKESDEGGALKASFELTYNDSIALAGANYFKLILRGFFGLKFTKDQVPEAFPAFSSLDMNARLDGIRISGKNYSIDSEGITGH